jgi:hypothetical protein
MGDELKSLVDDPTIGDETILYRRALWGQIGGRDKVSPGTIPPISKNFFLDRPAAVAKDYGLAGACMSVGLASVIHELGLDARATLGPELLGGATRSLVLRVSWLHQCQESRGTAWFSISPTRNVPRQPGELWSRSPTGKSLCWADGRVGV